MDTVLLPPTAWTTGSTEVFKTGTWRAALPEYLTRPSPCRDACPVNGEIAQWIGHARHGDLRRAWEVLAINNPFPAIAGRVCHHPCETACNRAQFDEAVSVCALERAAGDAAIAQGWAFDLPAQEHPGHVAVIGGGPAGLSAAYQLRRRGWRVSLYEARSELGGVMRYGIPPYRLARDVLDAEIGRIVAMGVHVHTGQSLDAKALERLRTTHDAVFVATGAMRPRALPQLEEGAAWWRQGTDYLAQANAGEPPAIGPRVLVIGGGSAAMDVARTARRHGCEVALLALEPQARMPAQREEVAEALEEGIRLHDGAMVRSVAKSNEGLAIDCGRVRFEGGTPGQPPKFTPLDDGGFTVAADTVLIAIGQEADTQAFPALAAQRGVIAVDAHQRTADEKVWAGGDVASQARFVTEAVAMGKRAAIDIDRALRGLERPGAAGVPTTQFGEVASWYHEPSPRALRRRLGAGERVATAAEVQLALTDAQVAAEAARCFSCGTCTHCDNCFQHCPDMAIVHEGDGYAVLADYCKGCGICVRECPTGSMLMREESK